MCQHIPNTQNGGGNAVAFHVRQETRPNTIGRDPTVWILQDDVGGCLEVWPAMGFNAYRWNAGDQEILYCNAAFFDEVKPTRSGFPILFPFPNRIRDGRFTWDGKDYQLPKNDPSGKNAIHGFVARRPWRVIERGADDVSAWLTGEFQGSVDGADTVALWPSDYVLRVTYRLSPNMLSVEVSAENPGTRPLPWGLGYHPYFRLESFGGAQALLWMPARKQWPLEETLPIGPPVPVTFSKDFRILKPLGALVLDELYGDLETIPPDGDDPTLRGRIIGPHGKKQLWFFAPSDYREMVMFTPPHRQAVCLEPYTCATDAINLNGRGIDAGWRTLAPGAQWRSELVLIIGSGGGD
jgi:aldose 1-epimerase